MLYLNSLAPIITLLSLSLLPHPSTSCFVVHYILYFPQIPLKYSLQMSQNSPFPYLVHLNQPLNLPNNRTFTRELTPGQLSDVKKVEVVYHHGGLYLDNDQFIDYGCVRREVCGRKGLFFLDWTDRKDRWRRSVPLSFIYASEPGNQTLRRSLQGLNQSIEGDSKGPRTVYFSGPSHMQQYRDGMSFIKIPKNCETHRADRSWIPDKPANQLAYQKSVQSRILAKYSEAQKKAMPKFTELWKTHTVIYPLNFNMSGQDRIDESYNHVQMIDATEVRVRVLRWAKVERARGLLEAFIEMYGGVVDGGAEVMEKVEKVEKKQDDAKIEQSKAEIKPKPAEPQPQPQPQTKPTTPTLPEQPQPQISYKPPGPILQLLIQNFYLLTLAIFLLLFWIGLCCYRRTRCCHQNNYENEEGGAKSINQKMKEDRRGAEEMSGTDLYGEELAEMGEMRSQRGFTDRGQRQ